MDTNQSLIDWTTGVLRTRLRHSFYSPQEIEATVRQRRELWGKMTPNDLAEKVLGELCPHEMSGPH